MTLRLAARAQRSALPLGGRETVSCLRGTARRPLAPERTILSLGGCFPKSSAALPGFAASAARYYERWQRVAHEDVAMLERQQQGLASCLYRPGRLSWRDELVHAVHRWLASGVPEELWRTFARAAETG